MELSVRRSVSFLVSNMIQLQGIQKTYSRDITALDRVDLQISKGNIIGIIGANGSGKSTLLKTIAGRLKPDRGKITVLGYDVFQNAPLLKAKISYISQEKALDPEMTGKELLNYFAALYGFTRKAADSKISYLTRDFSMEQFIHRKVQSYSGGQKQRLHLAIGVIHEPELLLLDEPGSALDPEGKLLIWNFICSYQKLGNTVVIVEHDLEKISQYCTQVVLLNNGQIVAHAPPDNIIRQYSKPLLQITSLQKLDSMSSLTQLLKQQWSNVSFHFKDKQATLNFFEISDQDKPAIMLKLLQFFYANGIIVTECHWQEPGLGAAYFQLTGKKANGTTTSQNKQKKQGRKKARTH